MLSCAWEYNDTIETNAMEERRVLVQWLSLLFRVREEQWSTLEAVIALLSSKMYKLRLL
jgi:hypothetical protein